MENEDLDQDKVRRAKARVEGRTEDREPKPDGACEDPREGEDEQSNDGEDQAEGGGGPEGCEE